MSVVGVAACHGLVVLCVAGVADDVGEAGHSSRSLSAIAHGALVAALATDPLLSIVVKGSLKSMFRKLIMEAESSSDESDSCRSWDCESDSDSSRDATSEDNGGDLVSGIRYDAHEYAAL